MDRVVAALAGRQFGVVARRQLLELGLSAAAIDHRVRRGRLHVVHRGVYAVGHPVLRPEGRYLAAVLAAGPGAVLSHASAAALWGFRRSASARIDVTARRGRTSRDGLRVHCVRSLDAQHVTRHRGIPVTTVARTLLDLAEVLPFDAVARAVDEAEVRDLLDVSAVRAVLASSPGRRGAPILEAALSEEVAPTRSALERGFHALCKRAGWPRPRVNAHVEAGGRLYEVDFHWPERRVAVETDGYRFHRARRAIERDVHKAAVLQAAGWLVYRFTWRQVFHRPAEVEAALAPVLGTAAPAVSRHGL